MTTFYFVRHGEPDYESIGEWSKVPFGREFAGLTENGVCHIYDAIFELRKFSPQIVITSPYTRSTCIYNCGTNTEQIQFFRE